MIHQTNQTAPRVTATLVRIAELPSHGGWLLIWSDTDTERHETAMSALSAVRERDRVLVDGKVADVVATRVEWETHSAIGRTIVSAITEPPTRRRCPGK